MFGQQKPLFGGSTNIFGQTSQPTPNLFSAPAATQPVSFGNQNVFGVQPQQTNLFQQPSNFAFGSSVQAGTPAPVIGASSSNLFGNVGTPMPQSQQQSMSSNMFGTIPQFGGNPAVINGTTVKFKAPTTQDTMFKGGISQNITASIQCISAMKEYEDKSIEELRLEDYLANRKYSSPPIAQTPLFGFGGQSSHQIGGTTNLFGQPQQQPNTGMFGSTTTATPTNLFGPPTSTLSVFGGAAQSTNNLFGQQVQQSQPSLFGQQGTNVFGGMTTSASSTGGGLFGGGTANKFMLGATPASVSNPGFSFNFGASSVGGGTSTQQTPALFGQPLATAGGTFQQTPSQFGFGVNPMGQSTAGAIPLFGGATAAGGGLTSNKPFGFPAPASSTTGFSFTSPLGANAAASSTGVVKPFSFGFPSAPGTTAPSTSSAFSFGPTPVSSSAAAVLGTGFSFFGAQPTTSGGALFGIGGAPPVSSSIFGMAPPAATGSGGFNFGSFGASSATTTSTNIFSQQQPSIFGFPAQTASTGFTGFNFGAPAAATTTTAPFGSSFNFGASAPGTGLFGAQNTTSSTFPNLFASAPTVGSSSTFPAFGAPAPLNNNPQAFNLFGGGNQQQPQQPTGSLFGVPQNMGAQNMAPQLSTFDSPQNAILRKQILDMVNLMPYGDVPMIQGVTTNLKLDQIDGGSNKTNLGLAAASSSLQRKQLEGLYGPRNRHFDMTLSSPRVSSLLNNVRLRSSLFSSNNEESRRRRQDEFDFVPKMDDMFLPRQDGRRNSSAFGGIADDTYANLSFPRYGFSSNNNSQLRGGNLERRRADTEEEEEKRRLFALKLMARSNDRLYEESLRLSSRRTNLKALHIDRSKLLSRSLNYEDSYAENNLRNKNQQNLYGTRNVFGGRNGGTTDRLALDNRDSTHLLIDEENDFSARNKKTTVFSNSTLMHDTSSRSASFVEMAAGNQLDGLISEDEDEEGREANGDIGGGHLGRSGDAQYNINNNKKNYGSIYPTLGGENEVDFDMSSRHRGLSKEDTTEHHHPKRPLFKCTKQGYYTEPSELECYRMFVDHINAMDGDERSVKAFLLSKEFLIENFVIGRKGYGSVRFPEFINIVGLDIDKDVFIDVKDVAIYPDDIDKPPLGEGMNRKAVVTLLNTWPSDKQHSSPIKDVNRVREMKYEKKLEIACRKMGVTFIDYLPDSGTWIFEVPHF